MIKDTNPNHYKVEGANFIEYMNDPKISGFGNWMFANGFNSGVWASTNWISVKDRLPDEKQSEITHDFEYVLCATTFGDVRAYKFGTPIGWSEPHFWHGAGMMDDYVTHWMPFPDMPVEDL